MSKIALTSDSVEVIAPSIVIATMMFTTESLRLVREVATLGDFAAGLADERRRLPTPRAE